MRCKLYFNKSDKNYLFKTLEEVTQTGEGGVIINEYDVDFLEDSSITDPKIKISSQTNCLHSNYLWLEDFGRYYYINNIIVSQGYCILECHVDVLMTYKNEVMQEDVIIDRAENYWNLYLDDPDFHLYQPTAVATYLFSNGFEEDTQAFLLTVVGDTTEQEENNE